MKLETKRIKQLEDVKAWLKKGREDLEPNYTRGGAGEFMLLIAMEQLVVYLEMKPEGEGEGMKKKNS